jgi:hypothetical protein
VFEIHSTLFSKISLFSLSDAVQDPDYFLITQPPNSAELRQHAIDQAAMDRLKDEVYNDDVKWPPMSDGGDMKNGTMPTEHFDWPDESKELTFFEKYYSKSRRMTKVVVVAASAVAEW